MKSSGIETLNYRMRMNLNRITNLTVSTTARLFLYLLLAFRFLLLILKSINYELH